MTIPSGTVVRSPAALYINIFLESLQKELLITVFSLVSHLFSKAAPKKGINTFFSLFFFAFFSILLSKTWLLFQFFDLVFDLDIKFFRRPEKA